MFKDEFDLGARDIARLEAMFAGAIEKERNRCLDIVVAVAGKRMNSPHASAALAEVAHRIRKGDVAATEIAGVQPGPGAEPDCG